MIGRATCASPRYLNDAFGGAARWGWRQSRRQRSGERARGWFGLQRAARSLGPLSGHAPASLSASQADVALTIVQATLLQVPRLKSQWQFWLHPHRHHVVTHGEIFRNQLEQIRKRWAGSYIRQASKHSCGCCFAECFHRRLLSQA